MNYDFTSLSPADFEDIVRELIGREIGIRFEAFAAGPDGGIDGRHARGEKTTIIQAKHLVGSPFSTLKSAMKRERKAIDQLTPARYILATSRRLTPPNKRVLAALIGPSLKAEDDIFGPGDLNALLRNYPEIERAHFKLWLSSSTVLDRLVHAAAHTFNSITREEIEAKVGVYAHNPSFTESRSILEKQHVLIISGPPGVGKTTLAEMLSFAYISDKWELVAIRSLDDGFAAIIDTKKQVFLFDDFLGKIALDAGALAAKDSDLARFMKRVRNSPNARFILTTRAYIFEEARRVSEHLADQRIDISKYVLDLGVYTRRIRARILYNHLLVARTPPPYIRTLIQSGKLPSIVDHRNYNPRVVEWMTETIHLSEIAPEQYPDAFLAALANPQRLWDTAYRTHIPEKCRHLLVAMFFCSQYGVEITELQKVFEALHQHFCKKYGNVRDPKDFEEAVRILEGSFIAIRDTSVNYINPSFRDYMDGYVADYNLLCDCANAAQTISWAKAVWIKAGSLAIDPEQKRELALLFKSIASRFGQLPTWKRAKSNDDSYQVADTSNGDRIELLLEWWDASGDGWFTERALEIAKNPLDIGTRQLFSSWRDSEKLVELIGRLRAEWYYENFPLREALIETLEDGLCLMVNNSMSSDDLSTLSDAIEDSPDTLSSEVLDAVRNAIREEFEYVSSVVENIDSESTLGDYISILQKLGPRAGIGATQLKSAVSVVEERMAELQEETSVAEAPVLTGPKKEPDQFDDADLCNLFQPLLERG
ncbi:restriction endonuclease [Microvirga sp. WGZ8]|uniref:Restriction endonuclease n=1 Tax=Microvirga puerhi TaxID=2876078 RepID=A0ABS7VUD6_9HYPH|nr:restriction endonuclease [Microvirga puerhi]MBZ6079184.1 restriction endonuclease [Microvirga puerhi]